MAANGGEAEAGTEPPAAEPFRPPPASVEGVAAAWEAVREARPAVERAKRAAPVRTGNPIEEALLGTYRPRARRGDRPR